MIFWQVWPASCMFSPSRLQSGQLRRQSCLFFLARLQVEAHIVCDRATRLRGVQVPALGLTRVVVRLRYLGLFRGQPWWPIFLSVWIGLHFESTNCWRSRPL